MKNDNIKKERGFTLLETIAAIFILLLSITGPMVVAQSGLRAAFLSRDQISSFFLAQDAIEYIKNQKDQNGIDILKGGAGPWLAGLEACLTENGCTLNSVLRKQEILSCPNNIGCIGVNPDGSGDSRLYFNEGTGFFQINSSGQTVEESIFARTVYVRETIPNQEAEVRVIVRWRSHDGGARQIEVFEYITNWAGALVN